VLRGENELYVANVGDSRAYRVRERDIRQMTRDHTWVAQQVDTGNLTPEAARQHARRTQLTRSLGRRPDVEVDPVAKETLQPGDSVVLCSDGLTDVVRDAEIQDIVSKYKPQEAADRLIELANHRGGPDNITAIVIHYSKDGIAALARSTGAPLRLVAGGIAALVVVLAGIWWATGLNGSGPPTATPVSIVLNEGTTSPAPEVVVSPAQPTITRPASTPTGSPPAVVPSPGTGISGPTPTLPPLPSPTDTPTPPVRITDSTPERVTPTSTVKITAITLDEPPNGQGRTGKVWLRWHVDGALGPGQLFEVKIWRLGDTNPIHTPRTTETQLEWCPGKKGNYVWQVQLINADGEPLGVSSLVWSFGWDLDCTEICEDEERASGGKVCHKECRGC
jgi:protein phosphatase